MTVFTDEAGTYDLTITTDADWTVTAAAMPNGDPAVNGDGTIAETSNVNGDDFNLADGTAWTIELWLYYTTASAGAQVILCNGDAGTATFAWFLEFSATEQAYLHITNTASGNYLDVQSAVLATSTWHHLVWVKETGNVLKMYHNTIPGSTDSAASGTARTPTGTYRLYLGTTSAGANDMNTATGLRIGHLAIYNSELSIERIAEHYLAMVAA